MWEQQNDSDSNEEYKVMIHYRKWFIEILMEVALNPSWVAVLIKLNNETPSLVGTHRFDRLGWSILYP